MPDRLFIRQLEILDVQHLEGSPAKPEIPGQTASEKQKMGHRKHPGATKGYSYRYYGIQPYWGPVVW
jgi:hypothetical protein